MTRALPASGLASVLALALAAAGAAGRERPWVALEVATIENTRDGCGACGCRASGELAPGDTDERWLAYGVVRPGVAGGFEPVAASSHCGRGRFDEAAAGFARTIGTPYVVLDLASTAVVPRAGAATLTASLRHRKLSGFDAGGRAVYASSVETRTLDVAGEGELVLPLLIADEREAEAFGVHEVLVRLKATVLGRGPAAAYGAIAVRGDVPGAEILLDGGFAGRIAEGRPVWLRNVRVGHRQVRVRDFSGREAIKLVEVKKGKTVEVSASLLGAIPAAAGTGLAPLGKNPQGHEEYWRVRDGVTVVRIPAGEFLMGSAEGQGEPHEQPQHRVRVPGFLIDKTEVTWRQLRKFSAATGTPLPPAPLWGTPDDYAASGILWTEATAYCEWAGGRLPTEAEWEWAARGADGRAYPWGSEWESARCNSRDGGPHRPESVGSFPACVSPYGVLEMAGGVWEWCADWYGEGYYAASPADSPPGPPEGSQRVLRGGAWMSPGQWLRAAFRYKSDPTWRNVFHGFRCVQGLPE